NVGYIIPNEEIDDFLADVADGRYDGKPRVDEELQTLGNAALRGKLGIEKTVTGMMVRKPGRGDTSYPIKEYDVITRVGETTIDNEGMVKIRDNLRLAFPYLVPKLAKDKAVRVGIVRNGQPMEVDLPVVRDDDALFPSYHGQQPSYFIYGPLVFSTAMA